VIRSLHPDRSRCVAIALGLIALSVALQWLTLLVWADPARTKAVLETLYAGRSAVLQALHVMALALLCVGLLRTRLAGSAAVCAGWTAAACVIEAAQHPAVVDGLLRWAEVSPVPQSALDMVIGLFVNARFAWSEVTASILGGAAAWALVRREVRR